MLISTKAIVLSKIKYKDSDLIVKCFTEKLGVKSYMLKGVLKSKKGKLKVAYFQPLTLLQVEAEYKPNRSLHYFKEVKLLKPYKSLHTNIHKSTVVIFLSELLNSILVEEEENLGLYNYIETALMWFDDVAHQSNFHFLFLVELSKYLGFYPDKKNITQPYFNLQEGCFERHCIDKFCVSEKQSQNLKLLLGTNFDEVNKLVFDKDEKHKLLNMILVYFKLHLEGFKTPKSLEVLNSVYS